MSCKANTEWGCVFVPSSDSAAYKPCDDESIMKILVMIGVVISMDVLLVDLIVCD